MNREISNRIAAFYKNEVAGIPTPPIPPCLQEAVAAAAPAGSGAYPSPTPKTGGGGGASFNFRRKLAVELVRIALTAAVVSGGILLPVNYSTKPVSQGIDRLFTDSGLQGSVTKNLLDAALMIGKSIAKE